jgi:toxin ParE1/3/4
MIVMFRPRARAELQAIWHYTANEWGVEQADHYVAQISLAIERAAQMPGTGSAVFGLPPEYRKARAGSHRAIYRCTDTHLIVVRIIHEREDVPQGFNDVD